MIQRILTMIVVLVLAVGGGYLAYIKIMPPIEETASGPVYATKEVIRGDITVEVVASGPLNPSRGGSIIGPRPMYGGTDFIVDQILFQDGDKVSAGQTVIRLVAPDLEQKIKTAEDELRMARETLADLLGVPIDQVEGANPALGITLRAPIPGRVSNIKIEEGEEVLQGATVAHIVDDSRWRADILLTTSEFQQVNQQSTVFVRFNEFEGIHRAEITKMNSNPVPTRRSDLYSCNQMDGYVTGGDGPQHYQFMHQVTIEGDNPGLIHPGMTAQIGFGPAGANEAQAESAIWSRYCAVVSGYSKEERVVNRANGIVTQLFVDEMEVVEAGDPILSVSGDETQKTIEQNLLKIRQKEEELQQLRSLYNQLDVQAPMDGVIAGIYVQEGQTISPGEYMGHLFNTSDMRMWVEIDDVDILKVTHDAPVEITVDALPGEVFEGTVSEIATAGKNESGITQFQVGITVAGGAELRPGMQAQARIKSGSAEDVLLVPLEAVFEENRQTKVEVLLPDGRTQIVTVELGLMDNQMAEVVSGLEEGQLVVTGSSADVLPGQQVRNNDGLLPIPPREPDGAELPGGGAGSPAMHVEEVAP